jgi:glycosyltransferase involved in cell wall biosynthesis
MKVVFLNATGQLGGAERVLVCLLQGLRSEKPDWTLEVITGDDGPLVPLLKGLGFDVDVLPMPRALLNMGEASTKNPLALIRAFGAAFIYRNRLRGVLDRRRPDVVQTLNFKMHLLAACSMVPNAKLCWHVHDFVTNRLLTRKLMRGLSGRPDWLVAISESVAGDLRSISKRPSRVRTVLNAVDLVHFSPEGQTWPRSDELSVGFIATFARWKGHEVFLRAVASLPGRFRIYIAGGGLYKTAGSQITADELCKLTKDLELTERVTFTGFLEDTAPLLRSLDVVVHASTAAEPFGLTVAEAMACGRAVVASFAGGITEMLDDRVNGLGHAPGDISGLARSIDRLLSEPELRRRYGLAARLTAEAKLDPKRMARQFIDIYQNC